MEEENENVMNVSTKQNLKDLKQQQKEKAEKFRTVVSEVMEDMSSFKSKVSKLFDNISEAREEKERLFEDLRNLVKTTDTTVELARDEQGNRVIIDERGVWGIPFRCQNGERLTVFKTISYLKPDNKHLMKSMIKDASLRMRIECFFKAVELMSDLETPYTEYRKAIEGIENARFQIPFEIERINDEWKTEKVKVSSVHIRADSLEILKENDSKGWGDKVSFDDMESWFVISQVRPVLEPMVEELSETINSKSKEALSIIQKIRDELAPVKVLDNL